MVFSSGATSPARAPASIDMLQTVMRPSIDMSRKVLPAYSKTWPVPRPDDVDDALVDAVDREIGDAELLHIVLQGIYLQPRFRVVDAAAAIARRHVVVGHRHRRIGPANFSAGELQPFEGLRRRDL